MWHRFHSISKHPRFEEKKKQLYIWAEAVQAEGRAHSHARCAFTHSIFVVLFFQAIHALLGLRKNFEQIKSEK